MSKSAEVSFEPKAGYHRCVCGRCGTVFYAQSDRRRWCSDKCRQKAWRERKQRKTGINDTVYVSYHCNGRGWRSRWPWPTIKPTHYRIERILQR